MKTDNQDSPPLLGNIRVFHSVLIWICQHHLDFKTHWFCWYNVSQQENILLIFSNHHLQFRAEGEWEIVGLNFYYWKAFLPLSETEISFYIFRVCWEILYMRFNSTTCSVLLTLEKDRACDCVWWKQVHTAWCPQNDLVSILQILPQMSSVLTALLLCAAKLLSSLHPS